MAKVTKLQKIDPTTPVPITSAPTPEVSAAKTVESTPVADQNRNCLFVLGYFVFVYLAMVAAFWMLAQITHQSDRRLGSLHDARTAAEIREALADEFGKPEWLTLPTLPTIPSAQSVIENSAAAVGDSVSNAAQEAIRNGVQEGATAAVQNATPK